MLHFPICLRTMDQPLPFGCKCCQLLPSHHLLPMLPFLLMLDRLSTSTVFVSTSVAAAVVGFLRAKGQALGVTGAASHLVGRIPFFSIQPNLLYDVAQVGKNWGGVWEGRERGVSASARKGWLGSVGAAQKWGEARMHSLLPALLPPSPHHP